MKINAETMTKEINSIIRKMKANPSIVRGRTAIYKTNNGMRVHIVVTRNEDDFCDSIVSGVASA